MNRKRVAAILCVTCLVLAANALAGRRHGDKKKSNEEVFQATMAPPFRGISRMTISIREYSNKQDVDALASTFAQGGADALKKACNKIKKGYVNLAMAASLPMFIVESATQGTDRRLTIMGISPTVLSMNGNDGTKIVPFPHEGYDYYLVQIQVGKDNKGQGIFFPTVDLTFNEKGQTVIKPSTKTPIHLANVHLHP